MATKQKAKVDRKGSSPTRDKIPPLKEGGFRNKAINHKR